MCAREIEFDTMPSGLRLVIALTQFAPWRITDTSEELPSSKFTHTRRHQPRATIYKHFVLPPSDPHRPAAASSRECGKLEIPRSYYMNKVFFIRRTEPSTQALLSRPLFWHGCSWQSTRISWKHRWVSRSDVLCSASISRWDRISSLFVARPNNDTWL